MVEPWVYGAGSGWVDRELNPAKFRVGEKGFLDGIRFRDRLIRREKVSPSPQDIVGEGQIGGADLFLNSQAAMILSGPWKGVEFNDQPRLKWGVAAIPVGPSGSRAFQTGGAGWGLSPSSSHPREAWDLLRFLSDASAEEKYARVGLALPALREVEAGTGYANSALEEAARALSAGRAVEDPRACNWPDVRENQINPILERVWDGELTPEKAAKTLNQGLAGNPLNMKPPERKPPAQNKPQMFLF